MAKTKQVAFFGSPMNGDVLLSANADCDPLAALEAATCIVTNIHILASIFSNQRSEDGASAKFEILALAAAVGVALLESAARGMEAQDADAAGGPEHG